MNGKGRDSSTNKRESGAMNKSRMNGFDMTGISFNKNLNLANNNELSAIVNNNNMSPNNNLRNNAIHNDKFSMFVSKLPNIQHS